MISGIRQELINMRTSSEEVICPLTRTSISGLNVLRIHIDPMFSQRNGCVGKLGGTALHGDGKRWTGPGPNG
jgi:hypothetical protein